jgi:hypothetical protein
MELRHSGAIARKDLSELTDEELMGMIHSLSADIGLSPMKTIDAALETTGRAQGNVLRLTPKT